jgi:myo-inositol-1(or 4)-monophosphatase
MPAQSAIITMISRACQKAGKGILRDFGELEKLQVTKKGTANFVTSADLRTEKTLVEELRTARPKFSFLTEESGHIPGPDENTRFVIDPIDGTTNFIHAIPYISISIAVQVRKSKTAPWETTVGVVYDPIHDEMFYAEKGQGAFMGNLRLLVSKRTEDLVLSTSSPRKWRTGYEGTMKAFGRVIDQGYTLRCSGSAALDLAYVAAGRLDGTWYHRLNIWDMAAGNLIVTEAGGTVTSIDGTPITMDDRGPMLATNGKMHKTMVGLLTGQP